MKAAQVQAWDKAPVCVDAPEPSIPTSAETLQITLVASGVHAITRSRAVGTHYSSTFDLPMIPGVDGVGRTTDGKLVYFSAFTSDTGSLAEVLNVPAQDVFELPEGIDPNQVAALFNPSFSSVMALTSRAHDLPANFTVLIMGASSASGKAAAHFMRKYGAGQVIGVARCAEKMEGLSLDKALAIPKTGAQYDAKDLEDVDLILDYLYGEPIAQLFASLKPKKHVQYVNVGTVAGRNTALPGAILRSKDITISGSGPGAWTWDALRNETPGILKAMQDLPTQNLRVEKLEDVEKAWLETGERLVLVP